MAKKGNGNLGSWAFLIGLVIAVILGLGYGGDMTQNLTITLFVIGLIVGLLNVADKEVNAFLMSSAILIIAVGFGLSASADVLAQVPIIASVLNSLLVLFVPATIIVAVKNVFTIAKR
jgi:hypothetical protein